MNARRTRAVPQPFNLGLKLSRSPSEENLQVVTLGPQPFDLGLLGFDQVGGLSQRPAVTDTYVDPCLRFSSAYFDDVFFSHGGPPSMR
jgi:hypothetical protein